MSGKTVPEILRSAADLFEKKRGDYAPNQDRPYQNFEEAAAFTADVSGKKIAREHICLSLIGVKISRMRTLGMRAANNEPLEDTLDDLIVYSAILKAMLLDVPPPEPKKDEKP